MKSVATKTGSWLLVFFGAFLIYDSLFVVLLSKLFGSRYYIGLDAKELVIGLAAVAAGFLWLKQAEILRGRTRDVAIATLTIGVLAPMLLEVNLRAPLWFTSRDEVTVMSGSSYGQTRLVRSRLIQYQDDDEPQLSTVAAAAVETAPQPAPLLGGDEAAAEAIRRELERRRQAPNPEAAELSGQNGDTESPPEIPGVTFLPAPAVIEIEASENSTEAQAELAAQSRYEEAQRQQLLEVLRAAKAATEVEETNTANPAPARESDLPRLQSSGPLGELTGEIEISDACGNGNDVAPASTALVERATGSTRAPSNSYSPDAESLLRRAIDIDPTNTIAYSRLGLYYVDQREEPGLAIPVYQQALALMPDCYSLYFSLGNAFSKAKDYSQAKEALSTAISNSSPVPASYHYNLANAYLNSGDSAGSIVHYLAALDADPTHRFAKNNLTHAYLAERKISKLLALHDGEHDALRRIGVTINRERDHETALIFFDASLAARKEAETYVQIGIANGMLKNWAAAEDAANSALAMEPGNAAARKVLQLIDANR